MDSHDISRGRNGDYYTALNSVQQPVLVLSIRSDVLYPMAEQEELHRYLGNAEMQVIESDEGHDGFLLEQEQVGRHVKRFLKRVEGELSMAQIASVHGGATELQQKILELQKEIELLQSLAKL
jgi:homoserine O-acetyltransferase